MQQALLQALQTIPGLDERGATMTWTPSARVRSWPRGQACAWAITNPPASERNAPRWIRMLRKYGYIAALMLKRLDLSRRVQPIRLRF
jgi:hypothetical protein